MEVHHHSPHPQGSGHRKKWTHYLWEFLMLFLAVFCGFIAENIREHAIEHKRAKEYARSLVEDLSADTARVTAYIKYSHKVMGYLDSLADIIGEDRVKQVKGGQLYFYGRFCNGGLQILWHSAVFEQIKNSGGLRYFRDISVVKKMSEYYSKTKEIDSKYETDLTRIALATELRNQVFRALYLKPFTRIYLTQGNSPEDIKITDSLMTVNLPLQSYDPALLNQLANLCMTRRLNLILALKDYKDIIDQGSELIAILKKEYHLD